LLVSVPREVISVAVRWYLRYGLSYRDVEELLAERGVTVDHVTIYRWVQRFTPEFIEAARPGRHAPGNRWFVDETYLKVAGRWTYVYRAVDQHGQAIDVLVSAKRDLAAARRFFAQALRAGTIPAEVTTDRAAAYPRVAGVEGFLDVLAGDLVAAGYAVCIDGEQDAQAMPGAGSDLGGRAPEASHRPADRQGQPCQGDPGPGEVHSAATVALSGP
jgi:hypothetical protein